MIQDDYQLDGAIHSWVTRAIGDFETTEKESHGKQSDVFRVITGSQVYFLKIAPNLSSEYQRLIWLQEKLIVPKCIKFERLDHYDLLLITALPGENLARLAKELPPESIVKLHAEALRYIHSIPLLKCPFGDQSRDTVLVHGDACLPNILYRGTTLSGYIDLGDVRSDYREVDLATAIWSLDYNLGPGFGSFFLKSYEYHTSTDAVVIELLDMYNTDEYYPLYPQ